MPFTDWHSGPPVSGSSKQEYGFVCMSTTVDDLSYTPSEEERSRDAAQFVATGRRSWKTLKGKGEAVWPPLLEAALLEALEKYQPDCVGPKVDKTLGRFPMRNRFISDYIFETTGKRRTPKQVGSRLQQLRDTCKKEKILQLISHRGTPEPTYPSSHSDCSSGVSPSPPPDSQAPTPPSRQTLLHIKIALQNELWPSPTPSIHFVNMDSTTPPQSIQLAPLASPPHGQLFPGKSSSNILPFLCGSVQFPSPFALMPQSTFLVYMNGSNAPVHMELAPLKCISSPIQSTGWLYGSDLVPSFWGKLCSSQDVSRYTIFQTLKPMNSDLTSSPNNPTRTISIVYKFSSATHLPSRKASNTPPSAYSPTLQIRILCTPDGIPHNTGTLMPVICTTQHPLTTLILLLV
ncbi:hypothetical protein GALMADRAFT_457965 [Galerina marginata CBS 339.88]|uniref:TEA domain-containing protein n=1 Tax=Galerina marginata (strain CBS 339.88) TaxID=685588 RepID=A0A067SYK4_GALM3|nr:hypothetical protein GALMADRAFT_457965 [Galerina marginata CBS 339.88]